MLPVDSSRLNAIGFAPYTDASGNGDLNVEFKDGSTGTYQGVPLQIFQQLRDAPSKGKYLSDYIISQGYNWVKTS
jgi:KTSC domain